MNRKLNNTTDDAKMHRSAIQAGQMYLGYIHWRAKRWSILNYYIITKKIKLEKKSIIITNN